MAYTIKVAHFVIKDNVIYPVNSYAREFCSLFDTPIDYSKLIGLNNLGLNIVVNDSPWGVDHTILEAGKHELSAINTVTSIVNPEIDIHENKTTIIYNSDNVVIKEISELSYSKAKLWLIDTYNLTNFAYGTPKDYDYKIEGRHTTISSDVTLNPEYIKVIK